MPTKAGGTEAAKNATAQIARLRIRALVPSGGVQAGRPSASDMSALEVAFRLEVGQRRVERLAQAAEQVGELGLVDDQRRGEFKPVAPVSGEKPTPHGLVFDFCF